MVAAVDPRSVLGHPPRLPADPAPEGRIGLYDDRRPAPGATVGQPGAAAPVSAVHTTLVEAVLGGLAEDADDVRTRGKSEVFLGDIRKDVVELLDWYIQRAPDRTPGLFGEICLLARQRLELSSEQVGRLLRRSLHLDSELDGETIDTLLDLALPPSAQSTDDS